MLRRINIRPTERALLYRNRVFQGVLAPGVTWHWNPLFKLRVEVVSVRDPWLWAEDLDVIVKSGALVEKAVVLDVGDAERALVWVDGRLAGVCGPGLYALWTVHCEVRTEVLSTEDVLVERSDLATLLAHSQGASQLESIVVENGKVCLFYVNGRLERRLTAGRYATWRGVAKVHLEIIDLREQVIDVAGQEIMTNDKVTLRINAVVVVRVVDAELAARSSESWEQALYRDAQLALREVVGARTLDELLDDRDAVATQMRAEFHERAQSQGVEVVRLGIRDVILPGEMKALLNRVTEARKAAEANLITRREETAAMRSQANTARLLEQSPTLMKLRELEVLEKVAETSNLNIVLGDGGLAERVVKLL